MADPQLQLPSSAPAPGIVFEPGRLVADPAFLRLIPQEKLKDIVVIFMRAQINVLEQQITAAREAMKVIEQTRM
jgi:hypothetical protein